MGKIYQEQTKCRYYQIKWKAIYGINNKAKRNRWETKLNVTVKKVQMK